MRAKLHFPAVSIFLSLFVIFGAIVYAQPNQPTLTAPLNTATGVSVSPNFTWSDESGSGANDYWLSVSKNLGAAPPHEFNALIGSAIPAHSLILDNNTIYYWKVWAYDGALYSPASLTFSFTTILGPPTATAATGLAAASFTANWTAHANGGATSYVLRVGTTSNGTEILNDVNVGNFLTYVVNGLSSNTTYYYSVKAHDGTYTSGSSNEVVVLTLPGTPTTTAATSLAATSFTANWTAPANGATGYRLDVATDAGFASILPAFTDLDVGNVLTYPITGLLSNVSYYYRVRAYNASGNGVYSNTTTALTFPGMPVLGLPVDNALGIPTNVSLNWSALPAPVDAYYLLMEYTVGGSVFFEGNIGNVTTYQPAGLADNTKYYWRLQAHNPSGWGTYSAAKSFTTALATPTNLSITAPLGNPVPSLTPTLGWDAVPGADSYTVSVKDAGNIIIENGTPGTNSYTILGALTPGATYKFDVQAHNTGSGNFSAVSGEFSFTILALPTVPTLNSPANNTHGVPINQTFTWDASSNGTITYTFRISTDNTNWTTTPGIVPTSFPVSPLLDYEWEYVWTVRAHNEVGFSDYAPIWHIWTQIAPPTLTYPTNNSLGHPLQPRLTWTQPAPGPNSEPIINYEVEYATSMADLTGGAGSFQTVTIPNQLYYDFTSNLANNTRYYWRVRAIETGSYPGAYSDIFNFKTVATGVSGVQVPALSHPIEGNTVYSLTPTLYWSTYQSGITSYQVQYATTELALPGSSLNNVDAPTKTFTTPQLLASQVYYWRARSYNSSTNIYSAWSSTESFITDAALAPVAPVLSVPANGTTVYSSQPTLSWINPSSLSGITFDVEIRELPGGSFTMYASDLTSTNYNVSPALLGGVSYEWRVTAKKAGFTSATSLIFTFTVDAVAGGAPIAPIPSYPVGDVVYSSTPKLYWYTGSVASGITYDVEVREKVGAVPVILTGNTDLAVMNYTVASTPPLSPIVYEWRVTAKKSGYSNQSSNWVEFTVYGDAAGLPLKPILSWPTDGAFVYSITPSVSWYTGGSNSGFQFRYQVSTTSGNYGAPVVDLLSANTSVVLPALAQGTLYYWRVRSELISNPLIYSDWSAEESFQTSAGSGGVPDAPVLTYPTGGVTVNDMTPTLFWLAAEGSASINKYKVEVSTENNPDFVTFLIAGSPFYTAGTTSYTLPDLIPGVMYYWRVSASYDDGTTYGTPSAITTFVTAAGDAPVVPLPVFPEYGSMFANISLPINWILPTIASALTFELQLSKNPDFTDAKTIPDLNSISYKVDGLETGNYFWRVRSKNAAGDYSNYSSRGEFKIISGTTSAYEDIIPSKFEVYQNYANPFNPSTLIKFGLPEASFVTVKIYNSLGQEVKTLLNEEKTAGTHIVQWNGDDNYGQKAASGTYIYRVTSGNNVQSMKMILMK